MDCLNCTETMWSADRHTNACTCCKDKEKAGTDPCPNCGGELDKHGNCAKCPYCETC
jgi:hypothetical protein